MKRTIFLLPATLIFITFSPGDDDEVQTREIDFGPGTNGIDVMNLRETFKGIFKPETVSDAFDPDKNFEGHEIGEIEAIENISMRYDEPAHKRALALLAYCKEQKIAEGTESAAKIIREIGFLTHTRKSWFGNNQEKAQLFFGPQDCNDDFLAKTCEERDLFRKKIKDAAKV